VLGAGAGEEGSGVEGVDGAGVDGAGVVVLGAFGAGAEEAQFAPAPDRIGKMLLSRISG